MDVISDLRVARENTLKIRDIVRMGDAALHFPRRIKADLWTLESLLQQVSGNPTITVDFPELCAYDRISSNLSSLHSPNKQHQTGVLRLLDSQFRLLRGDISGVLRDAVRPISSLGLIVHGTNWGEKRRLVRNKSPTPIRIYYHA
ncbi:hypothetical protein EYZ11_008034 [Aspergillus tanneri]|uniref:Uncharacterized protein n=1 Tax=Aspergillus tanneri TaxID=1220188 RepID=A0A4S3JBJ5_9EURO|nr:hypothetical protein EYZ11_008034 [Aspergillus tanneri]